MRNIKKIYKICLLILGIVLALNINNKVYAIDVDTKISFVGIEHSPLVEGDTQTFYLRSSGSNKVRYRMFITQLNTQKTEEATSGYTQAVQAKEIYTIHVDKKFTKGKYKVNIWVKEENSNNNYDSQYQVILNCVSKDDSSRVYVNNDINTNKDVYKLGEKVIIKGIKNISGMKGPYTYRLHVYNVDNNEWIIDNEGYRNNIEWIPQKPGTYVLDLWAMSYNSTLWSILKQNPERKLFEGWRLKVITVKAVEAGARIASVEMEHSPLVAGEKQKFYITSKGAKRVQYNVWVIKGVLKEYENITNGYSPVMDSDKPFEVYPQKKFWSGAYTLYIKVRDENSKEEFDNSYSFKFECVDKNDIYRVYTQNEMDIEEDVYRVGENITINGIKEISGMKGPYKYKLNVLNTKTDEYILDNDNYREKVEWTAKEPGIYLLELWVMPSNSKLWDKMKQNSEGKYYEGRKLKVIKVVGKDEDISANKNLKPYAIINSFEELSYAIENKYDLVINNKKVNDVYKKANEVINSIINNNMNELQKELVIHEYVVKNTSYDYENYLLNKIDADSFNPYGVLINGKAVCDGYSETMKLLLNLVGIDCKIVRGAGVTETGPIRHSWNIVKIDGECYHVDSTWNDGAPDKGTIVGYKFFNLSDEAIAKQNHTWVEKDFPRCVSNKYEYLQVMDNAVIENTTSGKMLIYYRDSTDSNHLYKMTIDGREKRKLKDVPVEYIAIDDLWIYYTSNGGVIYKKGKDSVFASTRLNREYSTNITINGDWIYYNDRNGTSLYKMKKDGSERQLVK